MTLVLKRLAAANRRRSPCVTVPCRVGQYSSCHRLAAANFSSLAMLRMAAWVEVGMQVQMRRPIPAHLAGRCASSETACMLGRPCLTVPQVMMKELRNRSMLSRAMPGTTPTCQLAPPPLFFRRLVGGRDIPDLHHVPPLLIRLSYTAGQVLETWLTARISR